MAEGRVVIQQQGADGRWVAETLDAAGGRLPQRRAQFTARPGRFAGSETPFPRRRSKLRARWAPGPFVGGTSGKVPWDDLDGARWLRLPKGPARRLHGQRQAGVRLLREGPTGLAARDACWEPDGLFPAEELYPYRTHPVPAEQTAAPHRQRVLRHARPKKLRAKLLQELEQCYLAGS